MKRHIWLLTALALLFGVGCSSGQDLETAPDNRYGEDVCEQCSMIISETRHAASYVTPAGDVRRFDDIGDMLAYDADHQEAVHVYWVHDFETEEWIKANEAVFLLSEEAATPMGWGLLAFSDKSGADAFLEEHGGTMTAWKSLQMAVAQGDLDPGTLSAHIHEHDEHDMEMEMDGDMSPSQDDDKHDHGG